MVDSLRLSWLHPQASPPLGQTVSTYSTAQMMCDDFKPAARIASQHPASERCSFSAKSIDVAIISDYRWPLSLVR